MAQLRMSDKLKEDVLKAISKTTPSSPTLRIPDSQKLGFEMWLLPEEIKPWILACPDPELLKIGRYRLGYAMVKFKSAQRPIHIELTHIPEEYLEWPCHEPKVIPIEGRDENDPQCPEAVRNYIDAFKEYEPKVEAIDRLRNQLENAMNTFTWANTFLKEIPQAKIYMPQWAMNKIYEAKKTAQRVEKTSNIDDTTLAEIKTALVKQALTG